MDRTTSSLKWMIEGKYRLLLHIGFWLFIYLDEALSLLGFIDISFYKPINVLALLLMDMITVYFNLYLLIDSFLMKGKVLRYVAFTLISVLINIEFSFLIKYNIFQDDLVRIPETSVISQLITDFAFTIFMLGTAIGAYLLRRYIKGQERIRTLKTEKLASELEFLKNQINPHFLFNALNNIYVLTRTNAQKASESVMLLSDLLRYQLYDCSQEKVKLKNEIDYLKNYLNLERIRKRKAEINLVVEGQLDGVKVSPFLFMPFIENAIKHGTTRDNKTYIDIRFEVEDDYILFQIENLVDDSIQKKKENDVGGIGLVNVKRRLELVYPNQHELITEKQDHKFIVSLKLEI